MSIIDDVIQRFISEGRADNDSIIGCSLEEIEEAGIKQGVQLPAFYREFLSKMGKKAGYFNTGTDIFYPEICELKNDMTENLELDEETAFRLPPHAFVFKSHQGYMFSYFLCTDGVDDPYVYFYVESKKVPEALGYRFSEWLVRVAEGEPWQLVRDHDRKKRHKIAKRKFALTISFLSRRVSELWWVEC